MYKVYYNAFRRLYSAINVTANDTDSDNQKP